MPRNPSQDARLRTAYRGGDPVDVLRQRLRAGDLSLEQVEWAARLGDPAAVTLLGDHGHQVVPVNWTDRAQRRAAIAAVAELRSRHGSRAWRTLVVHYSCDVAERALSLFEARHPGDARPRAALARRWAQGERVTKAQLRAAAASAAAYAAAAAADAAYAAANSAYAASDAAAYAYAAAAYADDASDAADAVERAWQQQRLAAYALGYAP